MSSPALHHVVYHSTATAPLSDQDLAVILEQSRTWNAAHGLTGVLLYCHGDIMQVLEGTEQEVRFIFGRIERDYRHTRVVKLSDGPIAQRSFTRWSMGFKALAEREFNRLIGSVAPTEAAGADGEPASLHALLASFATEPEIRY